MTHFKQFYVFFIWYSVQDAVRNTDPLQTTESYITSNTFEEMCNVSMFNGNDTFNNERMVSNHIINSDENRDYIKVNLTNCGIDSVNPYICSLCSLSRNMSIDLSWNRIRNLDGIVCSCHGVMTLDLSYNQLNLLKRNSFLFVKNIFKIDISENSIIRLEDNVFSDLKMLQLLDLSGNNIKDLNENSFDGLINLRYLNLSENKIREIETGLFVHINSLENLDMSCNIIHSLDSDAFKGLENLKYLNLSNNMLLYPMLSYLSIFNNLFHLDLSLNNFEGFEEGSLSEFNIHEIILKNIPALKYILKGAFKNGDLLNRVDISWNRKLIFIEESAFQNLPDNITFDISHTSLKSFPCTSSNVIVKATKTPLNCAFISENEVSSHESQCECQLSDSYGPLIVSYIADQYSSYIGQRLLLDCFAVGHPKPHVRWERVHLFLNGTLSNVEVISESYILDLEILSLNMEGKYRCVAESNHTNVYRYFHIKLKPIDVKIKMLSRSSTSILVTWDKAHTHQKQDHVLIYRAYETTTDYVIQRLNSFGKICVVRSLQPFTDYEICIASFSDINDKSCVRVMTLIEETKTEGIRYNNLAIAFLVISGAILGVFVLTITCRCIDKVRFISRQGVFIVGSESRECFADVTESTFIYENHHVEHLIEQ